MMSVLGEGKKKKEYLVTRVFFLNCLVLRLREMNHVNCLTKQVDKEFKIFGLVAT